MGEGAEMFMIGFAGAVFTERKKEKINEEKLDFKIKYTYPHLSSVFIHIFCTIYG
jgi:hypothetical protein